MTHNELKEMSNRIKKRREQLLYTQESFSEVIEISSSSYTKIENAFQKPSLDTLISIAKNLNVTLDFLVFGRDEDNIGAITNEVIVSNIIKSLNVNEVKNIATFLNKIVNVKNGEK